MQQSSDSKKGLSFLETFYLYLTAFLALAIILTPFLVTHRYFTLREENAEVTLLGVLVLSCLGILYFYMKEAEKSRLKCQQLLNARMGMEDRLNEAFKYIGSLNVQIEEIRSIFSDSIKYPENKKEMKYIMEFLAGRVLGIVDAEWVILRIVEPGNLKTLREAHMARGGAILLGAPIENETLVWQKGDRLKEYSVVASTQKSLDLAVFCVLPRKDLSRNQRIFLEAITNQLQMLFLIFTSSYYRNAGPAEARESLEVPVS
jgi:hypothetical protein